MTTSTYAFIEEGIRAFVEIGRVRRAVPNTRESNAGSEPIVALHIPLALRIRSAIIIALLELFQ